MFDDMVLKKIEFLTGRIDLISSIVDTPARPVFDSEIMLFLSELSKVLLKDKRSRDYSDVMTFAFWIRSASITKLQEKHSFSDNNIHLGRGIVFHIAPSNVPVNFAYSLVAGMLAGNINLVRIPGKDFPQVKIIIDALNKTLEDFKEIKPYIYLVKYGHEKEVNDLFSSISDVRIIWGGDETIAEIRRSSLSPRSGDITFADRYSLAIIDSDVYMELPDKERTAEDFYNDTFFSDQNACTSPRIVIWTGSNKEKAKEEFWKTLHNIVSQKYSFQDIQAINKLSSSYLAAVRIEGIKVIPQIDNLVIRLQVSKIQSELMDYKDNSGFFFEYDCNDIMEIRELCDNKRCQTVGIIGDLNMVRPILESGVKGIDRVVHVGKTMDFELIWDGYDLISQLSRCVTMH